MRAETTPKEAAIYARYSSHAQNDASIEQQIAECEDYARRRGLHIVARYADHAISGRSDRRPEFQKMLRAAERREFQILIAYKSNRISRSMLHALSYEDKLSRFGVDIVYCKEEFGDNAAGRFALRTMMNVNQFYSENLAEDTKRGMLDNAQQCRVNGSILYGYRRGEDGHYAIHEDRAAIVREAFRRVASGEPRPRIAEDLERRGVRTSTGKPFSANALTVMIRNRRYCGVYMFDGVVIPGGMPCIVDEDLYRRANAQCDTVATAVRSRRRRENMDYILTGKLFCGHCLSPMVGTCGTSRSGNPYFYYRCRNSSCHKKPIRKDLIERIVLTALRDCVTQPDNVEWMTQLVMRYKAQLLAESDLGRLEDRLRGVKTSIHNLVKAIEAGVLTETTKARLEELEQEQREILTAIRSERARVPDVTEDEVRFYFERFRSGDIDDEQYQKMLVREFLRAVYLYDDHLKITFDYTEGADTGVDVPLEADSDAGTDVLLSDNWGSQTLVIRTPARLMMIGQVFVLFVPLFQN